jgi:hypothetical protein
MSREEYDATVGAGRVQPNLDGREMKHVTAPPDADSFRAADPPDADSFRAADAGSVFVEFDVDDTQMVSGGRQDWFIIYGRNSVHGRNAARKGMLIVEMPAVQNVVIMETKQT